MFKIKKVIDKIIWGEETTIKTVMSVAMSEKLKPLKLFARLGSYQSIPKMSKKYIQGIWSNI